MGQEVGPRAKKIVDSSLAVDMHNHAGIRMLGGGRYSAADVPALDIAAHAVETPAEALALARGITPEDGVIVATGSIYLVGALREAVVELGR